MPHANGALTLSEGMACRVIRQCYEADIAYAYEDSIANREGCWLENVALAYRNMSSAQARLERATDVVATLLKWKYVEIGPLGLRFTAHGAAAYDEFNRLDDDIPF